MFYLPLAAFGLKGEDLIIWKHLAEHLEEVCAYCAETVTKNLALHMHLAHAIFWMVSILAESL